MISKYWRRHNSRFWRERARTTRRCVRFRRSCIRPRFVSTKSLLSYCPWPLTNIYYRRASKFPRVATVISSTRRRRSNFASSTISLSLHRFSLSRLQDFCLAPPLYHNSPKVFDPFVLYGLIPWFCIYTIDSPVFALFLVIILVPSFRFFHTRS